ncbi:hypothetical protein FF011L_17760 [Roseimaritima multifibrata]|uniref:Uncharacterized protein n=1 Tax=Roseimaritima multifibrata TaxID=1930274 RepID=A0A517MDQ6_9BACT|nr:hypothetical protein [Roseimaritima multifibrata]QDS93021.1 hypothetical protein FF011L_17760 [Roseimaritima multifibrata]
MRFHSAFFPISVLAAVLCAGCSLTGSSSTGALSERVQPTEGALVALSAPASEEVFRKIKQAKAQNSIVLQVAGDDEPVRVLPLPPEGQTVHVSTLLDQTGVRSAIKHMRVRVYRSETGDWNCPPMEVAFDGKQVRPENDYALHPGDRIEVQADKTGVLDNFIGSLIPLNTRRALGG